MAVEMARFSAIKFREVFSFFVPRRTSPSTADKTVTRSFTLEQTSVEVKYLISEIYDKTVGKRNGKRMLQVSLIFFNNFKYLIASRKNRVLPILRPFSIPFVDAIMVRICNK